MNEPQDRDPPSLANGRRVLINGPLQLTTGDVIKLGSLLVAIVAGWVTMSNRIDSMTEVFSLRVGAVEAAVLRQQRFSERLISLEEKVGGGLAAIERRLSGIENALSLHTREESR